MTIKTKVTLDEHIAWLDTCGHAHKPTAKLMREMKELLIAHLTAESTLDEDRAIVETALFLTRNSVQFND